MLDYCNTNIYVTFKYDVSHQHYGLTVERNIYYQIEVLSQFSAENTCIKLYTIYPSPEGDFSAGAVCFGCLHFYKLRATLCVSVIVYYFV